MQNDLLNGVGTRLRNYRKQKGFTLQEVGAKIGLTGQAVGNYENEKRELTSTLLLKFADLYGVPVNSLLSPEFAVLPEKTTRSNFELAAYLENNFDVVINGNISQKAYDEIMSFVDFIRYKYGYKS